MAFFSGLNVVVPPAADPVTVQEARLHSRVFQTAEDALIGGYIASATRDCEDRTKRAFMPQTWQLTLNHWPGRRPGTGYYLNASWAEYYRWNFIDIPKPPLQSIVSFTYQDTMGNVYYMTPGYTTTVGNYLLDTNPEPGRISLPYAGIWPTTILLPTSPIQITYVCGFPAGQVGSPAVNTPYGFSGIVDIDVYGVATLRSGTAFSQLLAGAWITLTLTTGTGSSVSTQTGCCNILNVLSSTQVMLNTGTPSPIGLPATGVSFVTNAVPMPIRNAILMLAAHRYDNREPIITGRSQTAIEIPDTVDAMLNPYIIFRT